MLAALGFEREGAGEIPWTDARRQAASDALVPLLRVRAGELVLVTPSRSPSSSVVDDDDEQRWQQQAQRLTEDVAPSDSSAAAGGDDGAIVLRSSDAAAASASPEAATIGWTASRLHDAAADEDARARARMEVHAEGGTLKGVRLDARFAVFDDGLDIELTATVTTEVEVGPDDGPDTSAPRAVPPYFPAGASTSGAPDGRLRWVMRWGEFRSAALFLPPAPTATALAMEEAADAAEVAVTQAAAQAASDACLADEAAVSEKVAKEMATKASQRTNRSAKANAEAHAKSTAAAAREAAAVAEASAAALAAAKERSNELNAYRNSKPDSAASALRLRGDYVDRPAPRRVETAVSRYALRATRDDWAPFRFGELRWLGADARRALCSVLLTRLDVFEVGQAATCLSS